MPNRPPVFRFGASQPDSAKERRQRYDQSRASSYERGYDNRWRKARRRYLCDHPLCVDCHSKGFITPANEVDHITPHRGDQVLFWDVDNWQALCKACHSRKTAQERRQPW